MTGKAIKIGTHDGLDVYQSAYSGVKIIKTRDLSTYLTDGTHCATLSKLLNDLGDTVKFFTGNVGHGMKPYKFIAMKSLNKVALSLRAMATGYAKCRRLERSMMITDWLKSYDEYYLCDAASNEALLANVESVRPSIEVPIAEVNEEARENKKPQAFNYNEFKAGDLPRAGMICSARIDDQSPWVKVTVKFVGVEFIIADAGGTERIFTLSKADFKPWQSEKDFVIEALIKKYKLTFDTAEALWQDEVIKDDYSIKQGYAE